MGQDKRSWKAARALLGVTLLVTLVLTACAGPGTADSVAIQRLSAVQTVEKPAIHVLGVDFDPPLNYVGAVQGQGVTLLVALENRGSVAAHDVRILARLHLGEGEEQVIERQGLIQELPPGQVVVYRFPRWRTLPMRRSYTLEIRLLSTDGLRVLGQRTYTLKMADEPRQPQPVRLRATGK